MVQLACTGTERITWTTSCVLLCAGARQRGLHTIFWAVSQQIKVSLRSTFLLICSDQHGEISCGPPCYWCIQYMSYWHRVTFNIYKSTQRTVFKRVHNSMRQCQWIPSMYPSVVQIVNIGVCLIPAESKYLFVQHYTCYILVFNSRASRYIPVNIFAATLTIKPHFLVLCTS